MQKSSTIFLRLAVIAIGLAVLGLCAFALPVGIRSEDAGGLRPLFLGMYLPAIPFFFALFQTLQLLHCIDKNKAFSHASVKALQYIKYCAFVISGLYMLYLPWVYHVADEQDAPGVMLIGLILVFAPLVIGVFAAVLQKLLQNAIAIKKENDLTV